MTDVLVGARIPAGTGGINSCGVPCHDVKSILCLLEKIIPFSEKLKEIRVAPVVGCGFEMGITHGFLEQSLSLKRLGFFVLQGER